MNGQQDVAYTLVSEEKIKSIVAEVAARISEDYAGKNLFIIPVLKGSFVFAADLVRALTIPSQVDFLAVSSYGSGTKTSGNVRIMKDISCTLEDKDVLIVEDILDSGITLSFLCEMFKTRKPKSLRVCTLFDKPERRRVDFTPDYVGCSVPDEFIVGYGLDYDERYRNLPFVGVLKPEIYE